MTAAAAAELELAAGAFAVGIAALAAWRFRADAIVAERALVSAQAGERQLVAWSRRLAETAHAGRGTLQRELSALAFDAVPGADGVLVFTQHGDVLICEHAAGARHGYFAGMQLAVDDCGALPARALAARHRMRFPGPGIRPLHPLDADAIAVPLLAEEGAAACVVVVAARNALDAADVERLAVLAEVSAPLYRIAREHERDRRQAQIDALTGLLTPAELRRRLAQLVSRARASRPARVALLFVDTDRFKAWNDLYGHAAGDALLRALAAVLRGAARFDEDLVARNGGDEFCLVFTETDKAEAIERAEQLRRRIVTLDLATLRPPDAPGGLRISASIGVAVYPIDAGDAGMLLERADAAMYHSKRAGRDTVAYVDADGTLATLRDG
jgi:diguanylate cyclase (GGDEF)-like protein